MYSKNLWGEKESRSGSGSSLRATEEIRRELPAILDRLGVLSLLDAPCGDFIWMRHLVDRLDRYYGVDLVPDLIARNKTLFGSPRVSFICGDIVCDPLPSADLILCRDCFIHLPTRHINGALSNFKATSAEYILLTSHPFASDYMDIPLGSYRPVDFMKQPFCFPEPIERVYDGREGQRQLCLWRLPDLPVPLAAEKVREEEFSS
jgi:hypothetical protein